MQTAGIAKTIEIRKTIFAIYQCENFFLAFDLALLNAALKCSLDVKHGIKYCLG